MNDHTGFKKRAWAVKTPKMIAFEAEIANFLMTVLASIVVSVYIISWFIQHKTELNK